MPAKKKQASLKKTKSTTTYKRGGATKKKKLRKAQAGLQPETQAYLKKAYPGQALRTKLQGVGDTARPADIFSGVFTPGLKKAMTDTVARETDRFPGFAEATAIGSGFNTRNEKAAYDEELRDLQDERKEFDDYLKANPGKSNRPLRRESDTDYEMYTGYKKGGVIKGSSLRNNSRGKARKNR